MLIILEYLSYGDLLGYLRKSRGHEDSYNTGEKRPNSRLTEKDLLSFAWMIADGMNYLATMRVRHGPSSLNDEVELVDTVITVSFQYCDFTRRRFSHIGVRIQFCGSRCVLALVCCNKLARPLKQNIVHIGEI